MKKTPNRLKKVGGVHDATHILKGEKRAYTVQMSQRMRGLPDAYTKTTLQVVKGKRSKTHWINLPLICLVVVFNMHNNLSKMVVPVPTLEESTLWQ